MSATGLTAELLGLLGEHDLIKLLEKYAGGRLYIPREKGALTRLLGKPGATALAKRYEGSYLRVPMARLWRAKIYRSQGLSNAEIARRLGMTETGVDKMWARMDEKPAKGPQMELFSSGEPV